MAIIMKKIGCILLALLMIFTSFFTVACDSGDGDDSKKNDHVGTYRGECSFEFEPVEGRFAEVSLISFLTLNSDGTYYFECFRFLSHIVEYAESGTYTLSKKELTLVPSSCLIFSENGKDNHETVSLSESEQESMTKKATLKKETVSVNMRWTVNYPDETTDMELTLLPKEKSKGKVYENAAGDYAVNHHLETSYSVGDGKFIKYEQDFECHLVLDAAGNYTLCTWVIDAWNVANLERGKYTIKGDTITLIPTEYLYDVGKGNSEMRTYSEAEQEANTAIGSYQNGTVMAKLPLLCLHKDDFTVELTLNKVIK